MRVFQANKQQRFNSAYLRHKTPDFTAKSGVLCFSRFVFGLSPAVSTIHLSVIKIWTYRSGLFRLNSPCRRPGLTVYIQLAFRKAIISALRMAQVSRESEKTAVVFLLHTQQHGGRNRKSQKQDGKGSDHNRPGIPKQGGSTAADHGSGHPEHSLRKGFSVCGFLFLFYILPVIVVNNTNS